MKQVVIVVKPEYDAMREKVAELERAFDDQTRELENALSFLTPEQLSEYRQRIYPRLYPGKVVYTNPDEMKAGLEMLLDERDRYRAALEAFLNPEKMGYAVTESVRDHVRGVLGIERVSRNA